MARFGDRLKVKVSVNPVTEKISYRTTISSKDKKGETIWSSWFIDFRKDASNKPVDNDSYICLKSWFPTFTRDDNGKDTYRIVVLDFDYLDTPAQDPYTPPTFTPSEFSADDLPF